MQDETRSLEELRNKARACYENCSDYSCVRRAECTGSAGHALTDYLRAKEREQNEDAEYAKFKKLMDRYFRERSNLA